MPQDENDPENLLEDNGDNQEELGRDEVDQFLEENYDELEAVINYKAEELGLEKKDNVQKKTKVELDQDKKKTVKNQVSQLKEKEEIDRRIEQRFSQLRLGDHRHHNAIMGILGSFLAAGYFLHGGIFAEITIFLLAISVKSALELRKNTGKKFEKFVPKMADKHPYFFLTGFGLIAAMFLNKGYPVTGDVNTGLLITIGLEIFRMMFGV